MGNYDVGVNYCVNIMFMWKASLLFVVHRLALFLVALLFINLRLAPGSSAWSVGNQLPFLELKQHFLSVVSTGDEVQKIKELKLVSTRDLLTKVKNPFYTIGALMDSFFVLPTEVVVLILSNLFFLLFLHEMNGLLNKMVTTDLATNTLYLIVLWPTSYEMSLGSMLSFPAWLVAFCIRRCMEDRWLLVGVALALLIRSDPIGIGLIPLILYLFWFYKQLNVRSDLIKRFLYLIIPILVVAFFNMQEFLHISNIFSHSAIFEIVNRSISEHGFFWMLQQPYTGQMISLLVFAAGAMVAIFSNSSGMHRLIPLYLLISLLCLSDFTHFASRALIAGVCLMGIAALAITPALRLIMLAFFALSIRDIRSLFY